MIRKIEAPLCLIYGKDDPWIVPIFAQRIKKIKPSALNFQLTPAGHCPHHESSKAVNKILTNWIDTIESYSAGSSDQQMVKSRFLDGLVKHTVVEKLSHDTERMKGLVEGEYFEKSGAQVSVRLIEEY
jgi:hypothetical protein